MANQKVFLVQYTLPNVFRIGSVRFIPGLNYITEAQWNEIKSHPLLPYRFTEGHLVWIKNKGPEDYIAANKPSVASDKGQDQVEDAKVIAHDILAGFSQKEAKELVAKTFDVELLEVWKEKEDRKVVLNAIEDQIKKINDEQSNEKS